VLVPASAVPGFAVPTFSSAFQYNVLPSLVQALPTPFAPTSLRLVQVQPNVYVLVHPSLYWGADAATAYAYAAQLAAYYPGFQVQQFNGPLGAGAYLAFHDGFGF
jgi:hypothetical protein